MATRSTARVKAFESSVELRFADIIQMLQDQIGPNLTAYIAGKDTNTVTRWRKGNQTPTSDAIEARMRTAYQVLKLLTEVDSNHVARAWFIGMNPQLDDRAPADVLREDGLRDVVIAAKAFRSGG
ncbi:hypothetical protein GS935_20065 [Rhodococcus hoagii]|nr:hypothetical protein [Prescottella equi]